MTLQQFIEKHALSLMRLPGWTPAMFVMEDEKPALPQPFYEVYANTDKTIWVSWNKTRNRFRICYCELVTVCSDWQNAAHNFELEPIEAVPRLSG